VAGVVPSLQRASVPDELSRLVPKILDALGQFASARERLVIDSCARIRNKLIHLELSRATGRLVPLAEHIRQTVPVIQVNLESGEIKKVRDTSTTDAGVFGWLLEGGQSGAFNAAVAIFSEGIAALDGLIDRWHAKRQGDSGADKSHEVSRDEPP